MRQAVLVRFGISSPLLATALFLKHFDVLAGVGRISVV
jgi:hypothetical protein